MNEQTAPDCFTLDELRTFQRFEGQVLTDLNYYLWVNPGDTGEAVYRFLYFLEMIFDSNESLLLTSGDDSTAIRIGEAAELVETAKKLQALHKKIIIQRISAGALPLWKPAIGTTLRAIRLTKNEEGLYLNDALLLDFDVQAVVVQLNPQADGLQITIHGGHGGLHGGHGAYGGVE
jgi:hypothetical protein